MTTLWITGASGVVGTKLVEQALASGRYDRIGAFAHGVPPTAGVPSPVVQWAQLAIDDVTAVQTASQTLPPDVIINPAAMTNVDACETRQVEALAANATGPAVLAQLARARGAHLLHVSTDYIFPGDAARPGPYAEDATARPINYYGETKWRGEQAVVATCGDATPCTVVRTALVYGHIPGGRTNFVSWLARELEAGRRVRIVRDQFNTPTLADDLAALLLWLAAEQRTGIYHGAGPELVGRHDWALAIVEHFGLDAALIDWTTTAELAQVAPRPLQSGLTCARWEQDQTLHQAPVRRGIRAGLAAVDWLAH